MKIIEKVHLFILNTRNKMKARKLFGQLLVSLISGLLITIVTNVIYYLFKGSLIIDIGYNGLMELIENIYFGIPVLIRLNIYFWCMTLFIYYILKRYEEHHLNIEGKREVIRQTYSYWYAFFYSITFFGGLILMRSNHLFSTEWVILGLNLVGLVFTFFGFVILILGRVDINGFWDPQIYKYDSEQIDYKLVTTGM